MIKFVEVEDVFSEIPAEVTLAVNISNCQHNCPGCHSPYLRKDTGEELTNEAIDKLIKENDGITCFCFMGEGNDKKLLIERMEYIRHNYPELRIGLYSGEKGWNVEYLPLLNYYKVGPYIEEFGPLNKETTNQRLYEVVLTSDVDENYNPIYCLNDITYKFWNKKI